MIRILPGLAIPDSDLRFTFTTSRGPGGQNVNKVATRAILRFNVVQSTSLNDLQRARVVDTLGSRINKAGILQIVCGRERSQEANRQGAIAVFRRVLADALRPRKRRAKTQPTKAAVERRLAAKSLRSRRKRDRRSPFEAD